MHKPVLGALAALVTACLPFTAGRAVRSILAYGRANRAVTCPNVNTAATASFDCLVP